MDLNRAPVIDANFIKAIKNQSFPKGKPFSSSSALTAKDIKMLLVSQCTSRHLDLQARALKDSGRGFYTIASCGHEGNAAIARALSKEDMAFLHYRSGAFMLERAQQSGENGVLAHALSLVAAHDDPISGGRHKVFGSKRLNVPPQTSTIASHLPKAVGAAFSIPLAKACGIDAPLSSQSLVMASFGDASFNHSTTQGAINSASWITRSGSPLPLLFVCEDNGLGISVPTPDDWVSSRMESHPYWRYLSCDGRNLQETFLVAQQAALWARTHKQPVFLHMKTVRLLGHAGSDIESQYRSLHAIEAAEKDDPLLHSARLCVEAGISYETVLDLYESARNEVAQAIQQALTHPILASAKAVMAPLVPPKASHTMPPLPGEPERKKVFASLMPQLSQPRHMAQLINYALTDILLQYPKSVLFGEDVAKKGGVYRVTADLQARFGPKRVFDTMLDEQAILGTAIGLAHNGFLPLPEIQFLAYVHNAIDQLRAEAASLSFFSNGQYTNPMVIRIPGLAYQKGFGGHFHNENALAALREIPGIIIACPSNGHDACLMLRESVRLAYEEQRLVIFLEPIARYMTKEQALHPYPSSEQRHPFGEIGLEGEGKDLLIISYGNGYGLSQQAAAILSQEHQINVTLMDLRWLAPLPLTKILAVAQEFSHLLIVDECRRTGSLSETLFTACLENLNPLPQCARITGEDTFIPIGHAWQTVLPSVESIIDSVKKLKGK